MNIENIWLAEIAAIEFLDRVEEVRKKMDEDGRISPGARVYGCAKSGALRRQSMELTRALAKMRKPF